MNETLENIATISLCDHEFAGDYKHASFCFGSLKEGANSYAVMNLINYDIPCPAIYLNESHIKAIRDWCVSVVGDK